MKKNDSISFADLPAEKKARLINAIQNSKAVLQSKKITAGFDGFIDTIARIIREKQDHQAPSLFITIKQFGEYILEKQGASFSLELEEKSIKLGGNMPIMANALGRLGISVNCIGALGYPQIHMVFNQLSSNCRLYSFAEPGAATAYEFNDGKMMMAQMGAINTSGWEKIKEAISIETLVRLYSESNMICLLNWSEIDVSTDIWKGLLKDVLSKYSADKTQTAFFDLSDCSKREPSLINEALELLKEFSKHTKVILSLNKNEAGIIYRILFNKNPGDGLAEMAKELFEKLQLHTLLLHSAKEVITVRSDECIEMKTFFTAEPKISTGAGDNFNAGYCTGQLLDLELEIAVVLANAVSGIYVRTGISPESKDIIEFLENN